MNNGILYSSQPSILDSRTLATLPLNGNILNSCVTPYHYPLTNNQYEGYKNGNDYVIVIDTTVNNSLTINISLLLNNNPAKPLTIDWGDGSSGAFVPLTANAMSRFGTFETSLISIYSSNFATTHTYPRHGQYIVKFIGAAQNPVNPADVDLGLGFNCPNIVAVLSFGKENGLTRFTLVGNSNLTYVPDTPPPQHSGVYGGYNYGPFINCTKFNSANVVKWDMSNSKSTICMFQGCSAFDQDLSSWNTSNITDMTTMFYQASSFNNANNSGINNWNTSNVTNMSQMFLGAIKFNQPINDWNTSKVTNMTSMFQQASFNQPINNWDTSNVTTMNNMFAYMTANGFNQSLDNWNVRKVTTFANMFINDVNFNGSLSGWAPGADTSGTNCSSMFQGATKFVGSGLDSWDTSGVNNMTSMFYGCSSLGSGISLDLSSWNVRKVISFQTMFQNASNFNGNLSGWALGADSSGINCTNMFINASNFIGSGLNSWDTSKVTTMTNMLRGCNNFNQPINNWNVSNVTAMDAMFYTSSNFNQNLDSWDVRNVTNFGSMFQGVTNFNGSLSGWSLGTNTIGTTCASMFQSCSNFIGSGLDSWNTSKVINMGSMLFANNSFQTSISGWNLASLNVSTALDNFMGNKTGSNSYSTTNYDALLIGWNNNKTSGVNGVANWRTDLRPNFGGAKYTAGGAAAAARAALVTYGWTITDGGSV